MADNEASEKVQLRYQHLAQGVIGHIVIKNMWLYLDSNSCSSMV